MNGKHQQYCPAHDSPLLYFCTTCTVAVCSDCAVLIEVLKIGSCTSYHLSTLVEIIHISSIGCTGSPKSYIREVECSLWASQEEDSDGSGRSTKTPQGMNNFQQLLYFLLFFVFCITSCLLELIYLSDNPSQELSTLVASVDKNIETVLKVHLQTTNLLLLHNASYYQQCNSPYRLSVLMFLMLLLLAVQGRVGSGASDGVQKNAGSLNWMTILFSAKLVDF